MGRGIRSRHHHLHQLPNVASGFYGVSADAVSGQLRGTFEHRRGIHPVAVRDCSKWLWLLAVLAWAQSRALHACSAQQCV